MVVHVLIYCTCTACTTSTRLASATDYNYYQLILISVTPGGAHSPHHVCTGYQGVHARPCTSGDPTAKTTSLRRDFQRWAKMVNYRQFLLLFPVQHLFWPEGLPLNGMSSSGKIVSWLTFVAAEAGALLYQIEAPHIQWCTCTCKSKKIYMIWRRGDRYLAATR